MTVQAMTVLERLQYTPKEARVAAWLQLLLPHLPHLSHAEAAAVLSAVLHFGQLPRVMAPGPGRQPVPAAQLVLPPIAAAVMQSARGGFDGAPTELLLLLVRAFSSNDVPLPPDALQAG